MNLIHLISFLRNMFPLALPHFLPQHNSGKLGMAGMQGQRITPRSTATTATGGLARCVAIWFVCAMNKINLSRGALAARYAR